MLPSGGCAALVIAAHPIQGKPAPSLMNKFLLALFLSLLLIVPSPGQTPTPPEKMSPDDVWVSISFSEKGADQPPVEYYGTIKRTMLTAMLNTATPSGFLKLSHAAIMTVDARSSPHRSAHPGDETRIQP